MSMLEFIKGFENEEEKNLNVPLIKRECEEDLISFIIDIYKSLECTSFIKFLGYEIEKDESKIDTSKYITSRKKTKKKDMNIRYQYIHPDRCIELTLKFKITVKDESTLISKSILIPKIDFNKYYTIRGKKYFLLYQLVDNSTYTSRSGLTLKSLMPICVNRTLDTLKDVEGNETVAPYYFINTFKREFESLLFYFSKYGFKESLKIFTVDEIIDIIPNDGTYTSNDEEYMYFTINKNIMIRVIRHFFENYLYVQSMVLMIVRACNNRTNMDHLEDQYYWVQRLGTAYTQVSYKLYDSGKSTIAFFERLLDITTQKMLKLSDIHKQDVYHVVAWIIKNCVDLKKKDNLDLENKRLRLYEYVAAILNKRVSEGINRILTLGSKIKLKQVKDVFKFPGTIIFQLLYTASLLKYDDRVNDLNKSGSADSNISNKNLSNCGKLLLGNIY